VEGVSFVEFIAFLGFVELLNWRGVDGQILIAMGNTINSMNPMNKEGSDAGQEPRANSQEPTTARLS